MLTPDDLETALGRLDELDTEGMTGHLQRFVDDLEAGVAMACEAAAGWALGEVAGVICLGMGGSASGADALAAVMDRTAGAPQVRVVRDYVLPAWWTPEWLIVATSYSGSTEETLSATQAAVSAGGRLVCISSGGPLASLAEAHGGRLLAVPAGQPPRSAFGHLFGRLYGLAQGAGWVPTPEADEWSAMLERLRGHVARADLVERGMASEVIPLIEGIWGRELVIVSAPGLAAAGYRFRTQVNENSGLFARDTVLPEQNHNEIIAWEAAYGRAEGSAVAFLEWAGQHPRVGLRAAWMADALPTSHAWRITCEGETLVEAILYACIVMDWTSIGLALLNGKDPTSIGPLDAMKAHLRDR